MKALVPALLACLASAMTAGCDWQQPKNEWVYENITGNAPAGYEFGHPAVNDRSQFGLANAPEKACGTVAVTDNRESAACDCRASI